MRESRQRGECCVRPRTCTHREALERRHVRERCKAVPLEIRALAAPEVLEGLRPAQRDEAVVCRHRTLRHQHPQSRDRRDVPHGDIVAEPSLAAERAEVRQTSERSQAIGCQLRDMPEEAEPEEAVEAGKASESRSLNGPSTIRKLGSASPNDISRSAAHPLPRLEHGEVGRRSARVGHEAAVLKSAGAFAAQRVDGAIARPSHTSTRSR